MMALGIYPFSSETFAVGDVAGGVKTQFEAATRLMQVYMGIQLLAETNARARKKAAEAITDASDEDKQKIPMYVRNVAWLERNVGCDKKSVLEKIAAEADPRALPALKILAATRRDGCREFLFASDCLECIREELARVIGRLEARAAPP
jgi:eukaryotic-like serine/threonine-protein kinase